MGIESKAAKEQQPEESLELFLGGRRKQKRQLPYPEDTEFRYFVGCLSDPKVREEYEALMTRSFQCQNLLEKEGDVALLDMNGTFDKQGRYHVASRYAYLTKDVKNEDDDLNGQPDFPA